MNTAPKKKTVGVIFGGKSAEHDVSIITAHTPIIQSLRAMKEQYSIVPIYIAKDGTWYSSEEMQDISFFQQNNFARRLTKHTQVDLRFDDGLTLVFPGIFTKTQKVDIVFPAMHGTFGEDGSLMGLLRMAGVPFVGCDLFASAIAMDKMLTKQIASAEGLPVVPSVWFTSHEWETDRGEVLKQIQKLSRPIFVKPVHLGSSIAIAKVSDETELERAIEVALHYDNKVLVEESIENLVELTLPIMGNDEPRPAAIERPLNRTEFFNFDDKYLAGGKKGGEGANSHYSEIPAQIDEQLAKKVISYGKTIYRAIGATGIARIDFLADNASDTLYINEINTLPGSLYHHNWKKVGVSNVELVSTLIKLAEERFAKERALTRTFDSDILKKTGGAKQ